MAKGRPYSNIQDIINGIATGEVNAQNYEDLLKAIVKDPVDYALKKSHIEDAINHYSRNLTAQQANNLSPIIANTTILKRGLDNLIEKMQAAKQQENPSAVRQIQRTIGGMPADEQYMIAPQVVQKPSKNTAKSDLRGSGSNNLSANAPIKIDSTGENDVKVDPKAYSKLAALADALFYNNTSTNPALNTDSDTSEDPNLLGAIATKQLPIPDVNIGAATVPVTGLSEPSRRELYNTGKILGNSLRNVADNVPGVLRDFYSTQSTQAPVNPRREAANHLYNIINQPDNFEVIKDKPVAAPQAKQPTKTPQKQKALQNLTKDISTARTPVQIARPDYTNIAYGSQVQPVQPTESPLDESYYRYLRNNGWNDFDARRQAIRYY